MKKKIFSIIIARGGSKGIKNKNLIKFNRKPLIYWTIKQSLISKNIDEVWVSSDSKKILNYAKKVGAKTLLRPTKFSKDDSTSESAWTHAINNIENIDIKKDLVIAPQLTSPLRSNADFDKAINLFIKKKSDSLFSGFFFEIFFNWKYLTKKITPNYDLKKRRRRQNLSKSIIENGSFYIFKINGFLKNQNRLFGEISCYIMPKAKSFQIDEKEDLKFLNILSSNDKNLK